MRWWKPLASAALLVGCFTSAGDEELIEVALSDTRLVGTYSLVDYLSVYGDGLRLDPSILTVTGNLFIRTDSSYLQGIRVGNDSTPTPGRIARIRVEGRNADRGELELTLEQGASTSTGISSFSFRHDTLVLVTVVSKERDAAKKGFRETTYYTLISAVGTE
ncbi:MAG: hypothetical protein M3Y08_00175 [Fibrobacterota bacterium]|nr:hypothetical protein [Fibrobacterota bacterium]